MLQSLGFGSGLRFYRFFFYRCRVIRKDWRRCVGGGELGHKMTRVGVNYELEKHFGGVSGMVGEEDNTCGDYGENCGGR